MDSPESDGAEGGGGAAREEVEEVGEGRAVVDTAVDVDVVEDDFDDDLTEEQDLEVVVFLPLDELEDDFAFEETIGAGGADAGAGIDAETGVIEEIEAETSDEVLCGSFLIADAGGGDDAGEEGDGCASQMVDGEADDA